MDFGRIARQPPAVVARPGSAADVASLIGYARRTGLPVAARGQGHSTGGQALAPDGLVLDTGRLSALGPVTAGRITVGAGARWLDVLHAALAAGLTPPVLTDYLELSVGGTLAAGGIGGASGRYGLQVDTVTAAEVVDGTGEPRTCTPTREPALFDAVLGGLGQCGVLTSVTLRLVAAPPVVRVYHLAYAELTEFVADQQRLLVEDRFDSLQGQVVPAAGGWAFRLEVATGRPDPDDATLLAGLRGTDPEIVELPYPAWAARLGPPVELLRQLGPWEFPHPWLNLFLPADRVAGFVAELLAGLRPADVGAGPILLYPIRTDRARRPFVRLPAAPIAFLLALLRTAVPPDTGTVDRMVAANRALYDAAHRVGGTCYPVGTVPVTPADRAAELGPAAAAFDAAKDRYDPHRVFASALRGAV